MICVIYWPGWKAPNGFLNTPSVDWIGLLGYPRKWDNSSASIFCLWALTCSWFPVQLSKEAVSAPPSQIPTPISSAPKVSTYPALKYLTLGSFSWDQDNDKVKVRTDFGFWKKSLQKAIKSVFGLWKAPNQEYMRYKCLWAFTFNLRPCLLTTDGFWFLIVLISYLLFSLIYFAICRYIYH